MMNTEQLQGSWNKLRGQVKQKWAELTDDDLQFQGGDIDQLVGKIQQKTGESREAIERYLQSLTSSASSAVSQATEHAGQYIQDTGRHLRDRYQDVSEQMNDRYQDVSEQMSDRYESLEQAVRAKPTQSVAAALGVGLVAGVLVGLAMRSR